MNKTEITEAVNTYLELKPEEKALSDKIGKLNKAIKDYMISNTEDNISTDVGSVNLSTRKKEVWDEDSMIAYIKSLGLRGIVKKKEYIDFDALESALYHDKFNDEQKSELNKFKTVNETYVLTIGK